MPPGVMALAYSYNYGLVALSALIAIFASYAALDLAGRVTAAHGRSRASWLARRANAMGLGIWSVHYIGMLAFRLPVRVFFEGTLSNLSAARAVAAAARLEQMVRAGEKLGLSDVLTLLEGEVANLLLELDAYTEKAKP
jgi:NO-binding membrane sensor protein with MHYT domain